MTPGLSRKVIGDLLGEQCERCKRLLVIYASTFEFKGACLLFESCHVHSSFP